MTRPNVIKKTIKPDEGQEIKVGGIDGGTVV